MNNESNVAEDLTISTAENLCTQVIKHVHVSTCSRAAEGFFFLAVKGGALSPNIQAVCQGSLLITFRQSTTVSLTDSCLR